MGFSDHNTQRITRGWTACAFVIATLLCSIGNTETQRAQAWGFGDSPTTAFALDGFAGEEKGAQGLKTLEDTSGNIFVVGWTAGTLDVDPSPATQLVGDFSDPIYYVAKYSSSGSLLWAYDWKQAGGRWLEIFGSALGENGSIILSGATPTFDLDPTGGVDSVTALFYDPFIMKINADGTYAWGHTFSLAGSSPNGQIRNLRTNSAGNIFAVFDFEGTMSLPGTSIASTGGDDVVIARLSPDGTTLVWSATVQSPVLDWSEELLLAPDGGVFVVGGTRGSSLTVRGADSVSTVASFPGDGDYPYFVSLSPAGNVRYAVGRLVPTDLLRTAVLRSDGSLLVNTEANAFLGVSTTGVISTVGNFEISAGAAARVTRMLLLPSGELLFVGNFKDGTIDFDPTAGTANRTVSVESGFIVRMTSTFGFASMQVFAASDVVLMSSLSLANGGGYFATGRTFASTMNLSNTEYAGTHTRTPLADSFAFVIKFDAAGNSGVPTTTTTATTTTTTATTTTTTTVAPTTTIPAVSAPLTASYSPGNGKVTLRWAPVIGASTYVVTSSSGAVKCATNATTCAVNTLKNGKSYTFSIRSLNSADVVSASAKAVKVIPGFTVKSPC